MNNSKQRLSKREQRKQRQQQRRWQRIIVAIIAVLAIGALATFIALDISNSTAEIEGVEHAHEELERDHIEEEIEVAGLPPMGGAHSSAWQNCGIYTEPINTENALHSLEHGAVWVAYQPELGQDAIDNLQQAVRRGGTHVLLSPYSELESPVVLTAWGIQLAVDSAEDGRIDDFIEKYEQGSQTPEPGATCSGGVGEPIT
jgi:hypothetical protein